MKHRLIRAAAALAVPLAIAASAAPAQAGPHTSGATVPSARSAAPSCTDVSVVAKLDLAAVVTSVIVDAVCHELIPGITVKFAGTSTMHVIPRLYGIIHVPLAVDRHLDPGTVLCVEVGGAEACTTVQL